MELSAKDGSKSHGELGKCPAASPFRRKSGVCSRPSRLLAWIGATAFLLLPIACALRQQGKGSLVAEPGAVPTPAGDVTGKTALCPAAVTPPRAPGPTIEYTAKLSETHPTVALSCQEDTAVVPAKLKDGIVCPAGTSADRLGYCTESSAAARNEGLPIAVGLSGLMGGPASPAVTWKETDVEKPRGKKYELSLPALPLPLLDAKFTTGCAPAADDGSQFTATCLMKVTVEARKSAATDQTVHCAYGANSNKARPTVTMTAQNNKVTLVCGNKDNTEIQPADYQTNYCADPSVGTACKEEAYTTFIKDFKAEWWTRNESAQSVTLTLPPENFPDTAKTIHLGCQYKSQNSKQPQDQESAASQPTICVVDVVISARSSSGSGTTVTVLPSLIVAAAILTVTRVIWL